MLTQPDPTPVKAEGQRAEKATLERSRLRDLIRECVLSDLGRPPNLHLVDVRQLWGDNYRVNVFVGKDAISARVVHSYFLEADGTGRVLTSNPAIKRLY